MTNLFVYGTLLSSDWTHTLLGRPIEYIDDVLLEGYKRTGRLSVVPDPEGKVTDGRIMRNLTDQDIAILDRYENEPISYTRTPVDVILSSGDSIPCEVYVWNGNRNDYS